MSALGQKRKWPVPFAMSGLPPKADIRRKDRQVRFGPLAEAALHSFTRSYGGTLATMVIQAARLAAILVPIARGLRPAEKGGARL